MCLLRNFNYLVNFKRILTLNKTSVDDHRNIDLDASIEYFSKYRDFDHVMDVMVIQIEIKDSITSSSQIFSPKYMKMETFPVEKQ